MSLEGSIADLVAAMDELKDEVKELNGFMSLLIEFSKPSAPIGGKG